MILRHPDVVSIKTAPPKVEEGKRYKDVDVVFDDPNDVYYIPQMAGFGLVGLKTLETNKTKPELFGIS